MQQLPVMVTPSTPTKVAFVGIVFGLFALLLWGVAHAGPRLNETPEQTRRVTVRVALGATAWLGFTAWVSASGLLERAMLPPPLALFAAGSMAFCVGAAFSPLGARLVQGVPIAALIAAQGFRLPLEIVLHAWKDQGVLPIQMTFEGHNFDIVSGVLALLVGAWLWRRKPPRGVIWTFNIVASILLLVVATIAVLSSPLPIRQYLNDPPVLLAFHAPYGWIIPACVGGALFGHILVFRWLSITAQAARGSGV